MPVVDIDFRFIKVFLRMFKIICLSLRIYSFTKLSTYYK